MTALTTASGGYRAPAASSIDRAIRLSTATAVLAVAVVAAYVSYWHAYAVIRAHGEGGITARLEPATIDGLVYASSMVILYAARHRVAVPALARWLLGLGIAATLTANMAQGWSHGPVGAVVAAWPAAGLVGSYELLVWLIRTAGAVEHQPPAGHCCGNTACRAPAPSSSAAAVDGEQNGQNDHDRSTQGGRPTGQSAGQPAALAGVQDGDEVPGADADDVAAVTAYRLSAQAGNPLSERKLAQMFGRTSRRWARARIADARQSPLGPSREMAPAGIQDLQPGLCLPRHGLETGSWRRQVRPRPSGAGMLASALRYTPRGILSRRVRNSVSTIALTKDTFEDTVTKEGITLVDWWASWCGPCRRFAPVFAAASGQHPDITFGKVDTEDQPELAGAARITSIPTLMAFRDGILVFSQPGALPAAALELVIAAVRGLDMDKVRGKLARPEAERAGR